MGLAAVTGGLYSLSATELAHLIRAGEVSATEVVEAFIARIEQVNPALNALIIPLFAEARTQAQAAQQALAQGESVGPLHGVPVTIKEQFLVRGTDTTWGVPAHRGKPAGAEGTLVTALRRAGAIILGKTNVPQILVYYESDNPVYGQTKNPWNPQRTPGGSSGGEAALIAAHGSPLGLGGDLGGSVRVPAHFSGIHGLKPTAGRLTNDDNPVPLPHLGRSGIMGRAGLGQEGILPQQGPMARTVADLALAMQIFASAAASPTYDLPPPVPWQDPAEVDVKALRVGFYTDNGFMSPSPAVRRVVTEAVAALERKGVAVTAFPAPEPVEAMQIFFGILGADGGQWLREMLAGAKPDFRAAGMLKASSIPRPLRPLVAKAMRLAGQQYLPLALPALGPASARDYMDWVARRSLYREQFVAAMDKAGIDAIICPPHALAAPPHRTADRLFMGSGSYSYVYNVLGMPAGVLAAARVRPDEEGDRPPSRDAELQAARAAEMGSAGLPVGVQVVARHWREDVVLALMQALEQHFQQQTDYPCDLVPAGL